MEEREYFRLTEFSLRGLRGLKPEETPPPSHLIDSLESLQNQKFCSEDAFWDAVKNKIGEEQAAPYKTHIVQHAKSKYDSVVELAREQFKEKHYEEASQLYYEALLLEVAQENEAEEILEELDKIGGIYEETYHNEKALNIYQKILSFTPNHSSTVQKIADIYFNLGRYDDAVEFYINYYNIDRKKHKKILENIYRIGKFFIEAQQFEQALQIYEKLYQETEVNDAVDKICEIGDIFVKEKDYEKATHIYEKAYLISQTSEKREDSYILNKIADIANIWASKQEYEQAVQVYQKVIGLFSVHAISLYEIAGCYRKLQEYDKAIKEYINYYDLDPEQHKDILKKIYDIGDELIQNEEYQTASQAFETCYLADHDSYALQKMCDLANILIKKNNQEEAINTYRKVLDLDSSYGRAIHKLGEIYYTKNDYQKAANMYLAYLESYNVQDVSEDKVDDKELNQLFDKLFTIGYTYAERPETYRQAIEIYEAIDIFFRDKKEEEHRNIFSYYEKALRQLINLYKKSKEYEKAIEICSNLLEPEEANWVVKEIIEVSHAHAEEATENLRKMISQYTHTLGNALFPDRIQEAVDKLKVQCEFAKEILNLRKTYRAERLVKLQGLLLQTKHSGDTSGSDFRRSIRRSCLPEDTTENFRELSDILNFAVEGVLIRFFEGKLKQIQQQMEQQYNKTADHWKESFEQAVLIQESETAIAWTRENFAVVEYSLSPLWKSVKVENYNYAEALLFGYFGELLWNALKYHDVQSNKWTTIDFSQEDNYLTIVWRNPCVQRQKPMSIVGGWGLRGIQSDLLLLNQAGSPPQALDVSVDNQIFSVKLYFLKGLFIKERRRSKKAA